LERYLAELARLLSDAEDNELSCLQLLEQLIETEDQGRCSKRIRLNLKKAALPAIKRQEEFDFRHQTTITKRQINQLLDLRFIEEHSNLVRPPGVGKTHLTIALGLKACEAGYKVLFYPIPLTPPTC